MSDQNEYQQYFPNNQFSRDDLVIDVPTEPRSPYVERIPSGYDPMGEIYLRGRAYRGLAGGRIPWWVLMTGWFTFGALGLTIFVPLLFDGAFELIPALVLIAIPLVILWRGTNAKLAISKNKKKL
ncbi:MAG: hypothetical protein F6K11_34975 [Leptolyngbya sp. SIO3F4]|nr:hypothetical protein [Leptolyngbya sp. SIO3F4]